MTPLVRYTNSLQFQRPVEHGVTRLAELPNHRIDPALTVAHRDSAHLDESYRRAAERFFNGKTGEGARIFVTSAQQGDGKTCTATNLASSLARSGRRVLLAELNFSQPRLLSALGNLRMRYGLETALRQWVQPAEAIFYLASTGLHIAPVRDPIPPDRLPPLIERLQAFFAWAGDRFDVVVLDCPSVLTAEWKGWLGSLVDSALLVVREEQTPLVEVRRAVRLLGGTLKGVLLNGHREGGLREPASAPKARFAAPAFAKFQAR
jgi:Mrp family chromosome partitioning ATPase